MNRDAALRALKEQLPNYQSRFAVRRLGLFGSVARGEAKPGSDLDVIVGFAGRPTFDNYLGLKLDLEDRFGVSVDLAIEGDLRPGVRERVEREVIDVA